MTSTQSPITPPSDAIRRLGEPAFTEALASLAQSIGEVGFEDRILALIGRLASHRWTTMTRYPRQGKPDYLVAPPSYPPALVQRYLKTYYRFDPFHLYWREHQIPGLVWLRDLSSETVRRGRYFREFLVESGVSDEVGLFLPAPGGTAIAFFLERGSGRFSAAERGRLGQAYPVLAGLYSAHVSALLGMPGTGARNSLALPDSRPTLVATRTGEEVYANAAWRALEQANSDLGDAARARFVDGQTRLPDGRILARETLDDDFHLAPGGQLWSIEEEAVERSLKAANDPAALFRDTLTPRERDIVGLILQGYPTITIAQRLVLSRGTVKNHRRRIYDKLDITSERELFLSYIERLQLGEAS